ncbi:Xyloglucan endotransglucosylase/hydrolase protein [Dioscorea alata]|uniref:Xyloglucan endotransglucosylase/hydrolase protein n=1 Tax=Dioscorea alata TaxID=55571 RepID=A0ACB7VD71_DIOAL|nr:Xyloglucan endotransglucosylase/hydrolase protein [Dioscorea alata]
MFLASISVISLICAASGAIQDSVEISWGGDRAQLGENGEILTLTLDQSSGSGFQSKDEYLFAEVSIRLKLVSGNSAGTVTAFYLSSIGDAHNEIDFEFLGNVSGSPYTVHTNVFDQGKGNKEQQFYLWFDPTQDFHTYTILWNKKNIIFLVDGLAIRVFKNNEAKGVGYPDDQAMRVYSSLWNAEDWATQGGRVKTDWSKAPFSAYYRDYNANACVASAGTSSCSSGSVSRMDRELSLQEESKMKELRKTYMVYNYCDDKNRFGQNMPAECGLA